MKLTRRQLRKLIQEAINEIDLTMDRGTDVGATVKYLNLIPDDEFKKIATEFSTSFFEDALKPLYNAVGPITAEQLADIKEAYDEMVDSYQQAAKTLAEGKADKGSWARFWLDAAVFLVLVTAYTGFAAASLGYAPLKVLGKILGPTSKKMVSGLSKKGVKPPEYFNAGSMEPMVANISPELMNRGYRQAAGLVTKKGYQAGERMPATKLID